MVIRSSCVLAAGALLAACSGDRPAAVESPPAGVNAPTPAAPAEGALVLRVMREGGGGIDATINQVDARGQVSYFATVPGTGEKAFDQPCEAGQRFQAEPKNAAFLRGPTQVCSGRVEFMLYSTQATLQFIKRGDDASRGGDLQVAQSNYGTAAERLQYAEPAKARQLRVLSMVAAGRLLGVSQSVQGPDGSEEPTTEFTDRLREFQKQNGIGTTGDLDARTREFIGRMQIRGDVIVVPPVASGPLSPASATAVAAAPALVVTPQAITPVVEVRVSTAEMQAAPVSPKSAAIIQANTSKAQP